MVSYVIYMSMFLFEIAIGNLLRPHRSCVPTATIRGPCHECVCHTDGVYHCLQKTCEHVYDNPDLKTCEPNQLYRQNATFCSCSASGNWRSDNCKNQFYRLQLKSDPIKRSIRTNIPCEPNNLYIIDCDVCLCVSGVISFDSCTSRPCPRRHKGDICKLGEVYRSANEFCMCSYVNYFIDRLCLKVGEDTIQRVPDTDIAKIIEETYENINEICDDNIVVMKDCNSCTCSGNQFDCTIKSCSGNKPAMRMDYVTKPLLPELVNNADSCIPGTKYRFKCNASNETVHNRSNDLPRIKEGDTCIPGQLYKMDCNRCQCTSSKKLICTKVACVDWSNFIDSGNLRQGREVKLLRDSQLPDVPNGACVPGRIYKKDCRRCFCNHKSQAICSNNKKGGCTNKQGEQRPVRVPEDVRPPFQREELQDIPQLAGISNKCEPGKVYQVNCNNCICNEHHNLICDKELCFSFEDMNKAEAEKRTGKNCTGRSTFKTQCIDCSCIDGLIDCRHVPNCVSETIRKMLSKDSNIKLKIDPMKHACIPNGIYTDKCNRCYCQDDGTIHCTLRTCLNYSQSKALDEEFKRYK